MNRLAYIGLMIAIGLGLSLRFVTPTEVRDLRPRADALEYDLSSQSIAAGEGFYLPLGDRLYPPRYTIGYPLLCAALRVLSGDIHTPALGILVTLVLGTLAIALGAWLAYELGGNRAAIAAALFFAISPLQIFHARRVMSDAPALFFTLLVLLLALRWARRSDLPARNLFGIALLAGFATTIRLSNALLVPLLAALVLTRPYERYSRRTRALVALAAGALLGVLPQLAINETQHGSPFSTGYAYWIPQIYDQGGGGFAAWGGGSGGAAANLGFYAGKLAGYESLERDLAGLRDLSGHAPRSPASAPDPWRGVSDHIEYRRPVEPDLLYPFSIALLALIGLGVRTAEVSPGRVRRGMHLLVWSAVLFFLFYVVYGFQEVRFLLPVQAIALLFAGRAFATRRRALRAGAWVLAGLALLSALPDLIAVTRPPQSNYSPLTPYGRLDEESAALAWAAARIPADAILVVHTHTCLFEREVLDETDRRWVPFGLDEHQMRIAELPGRTGRDLRSRSRPRANLDPRALRRLATYRGPSLAFDPAVGRLIRFAPTATALAPELRRRRALELFEALPEDVPRQPVRDLLHQQLISWSGDEKKLNATLVQLTLFSALHQFAQQLDEISSYLATHPEREAFFFDLYGFEFILWPQMRQVLLHGRVPTLDASGAPSFFEPEHPWKLDSLGSFQRPGFPAAAPPGAPPYPRFTLYRITLEP